MSKRVTKLTPALLRRLVMEEKAKMLRESDPIEAGVTDPEKVKPEEVDADEQADTLAKDIDFLAALKIKENKLKFQLSKVNEAKSRLRARIVKSAKRK